MACRGVHFALTEDEVLDLRSQPTDSMRLELLQEEIEERYFGESPEMKAETDKAWDAMHRALTDGHLHYDNGSYPLNHVVMGGEPIYFEDNYIMSLKTPEQVRDVAAAIKLVTKQQLREGCNRIDPAEYGFPLSEDDFEYTWHWWVSLIDFFTLAAVKGRYILFTVDQ
jgi:hypothetical protein